MNSKNAHLYLPFVQALAEGKVIEYNDYDNIWTNHGDYTFVDQPKSIELLNLKLL